MLDKKTKAKMNRLLHRAAPIDWEKLVDELSTEERRAIVKELEGICHHTVQLAGYIEERHGYGCGDRGHKKALKTANKWGKMIWMKVFGYNGYIDINV